MKKMTYLIIIFLALSWTVYLSNFFWRGTYQYHLWKMLTISITGDKIRINSDFWKYNSAEKISFIESIKDKENIYVSLYTKFFSLPYTVEKFKNELEISKGSKYKIYYKNPDWSLDFIQEVNN